MQRGLAVALGLAGAAALGVAYESRGTSAPAPSPLAIGGASAAAATSHATPTPASQPLPASLVGDGALAGEIDPRTFERVGDHYEAPLPGGARATLTLDPRYQEAAEAVLRLSRAPRGAVVAMAPDGRVLALAGRVAADPGGSLDGKPDVSLALDVWAPAASVFKVVTATALVKAGVTPAQKVCYHGGVRSVMESNLVDGKLDNACQDLRFAVAHSQNAIIGKLAYQHLAPADLTRTASDLGFAGELTDWALAGPLGSVDPGAAVDLTFAKTAAGFTGTYLSAVGGAVMTNTVATGGLHVTPRIVASVRGADGHVTTVGSAPPHRVIEPAVADAVGSMMEATCASGSAAKSFRGRKQIVAGKTGTLAQDEPYYMEYSWFVGFARPSRDAEPDVSISVVVGNAADWWMKAHTAAREILDRAQGRGPTG
jgi:peptidoglycan glycosyltransferase